MVRKIISKLAVLVLVSMLMPLAAFAVDDASRQVVLPGTIQSVLGGKDWDPASEITRMKHVGKGVYEFTAKFPKGDYQYKVAIGGGWGENYGKDGGLNGGNIDLQIPQNDTEVKFIFDYKTKLVTADVEIKGINYGATLTNTFEQKGAYSKVTNTNSLKLNLISKALKLTGTIGYNPEYDIYAKKLLPNTFDTKFFEWVAFTDLGLAKISAQVNTAKDNKSNFKSSTDYLQILDAGTVDDRTVTTNPDKLNTDNMAIKISTDKFVKLDAGAAVYVADLTKESNSRKVFGYVNAEKELIDDTATIGLSSVYYNTEIKKEWQGPSTAIGLFGEIKPIKNLSIKGEYVITPVGTMLESKGVTGTFKQADGSWKFVFDPSQYGVAVAKEVHIVGADVAGTWNLNDVSFPLTLQADGTWVGYKKNVTGDTDNLLNKEFKYVWDDNGSWNHSVGSTGINGSNFRVTETVLKSSNITHKGGAYYGELNYKLMGKYFELGNLRFVTTSIVDNAALRFAKENLVGNNGKGGRDSYYAYGDYIIFDRFKTFVSEDYQTLNAEGKYAIKNETKVGFDWNYNWDGRSRTFDYIKGDYTRNPFILRTDQDSTKNTENSFNAGRNDYFFEVKTMELPIIKKVLVNTKQRINAGTQQYFAEIAPIDQIAHLKGDYVVVKGYNGSVNAVKYNAELKLHKLPVISSVVSYVTAGFVNDDAGLIDDSRYLFNDGDDNDWTKRYYAETKVEVAALKDFNGLTLKGEIREVEDNKVVPAATMPTTDSQYYVASQQSYLKYFALGTIETGYKLFGIDTSLIAKYDFAHQKFSEYDDDGLKATASVKVGPTTFSASYNKKDKDNGPDYTKVEFKSVF